MVNSHKKYLYLIQGTKSNTLNYSYLNNSEADLIILSYDFEIKEEIGATKIFLPNSTWAEGRNLLMKKALQLSTKYLYYIFLDDDVEFAIGSFKEFEQLLLKYKPSVAVPLVSTIKETLRYNPRLEVQNAICFDPQFQAFSRKTLEDFKIMPLITKFDKLSWFYSCEIHIYLTLLFYNGSVLQFNNLLVLNETHTWDDQNCKANYEFSNYVGGITKEGLLKCKDFIIDNYKDTIPILGTVYAPKNIENFSIRWFDKTYFTKIVNNFKAGNFNNALRLIYNLLEYCILRIAYFSTIRKYRVKEKYIN